MCGENKPKVECWGWVSPAQNTPTHSALSVHEFWLKTKWPSFHTSLPTRHSTVWLISFPRTQDGSKEKENKWDHHDYSKIIGCTWWISNNALHNMVQMVVWSLGQLNKVPRGILEGKILIGRQVLLLWRNTFSPENIWVHHIYLLRILHCQVWYQKL